MTEAMLSKVNAVKLRLAAFSPESARAQLENRLNRRRMMLDSLSTSIQHSMSRLLSDRKAKAQLLTHKLQALSPLAVLERGYSIVTDKNGNVIKSASGVSAGDNISIKLSDGRILADVQEVQDGRQ
jgi:exodeoxyribonuclease VII large subunit